MKVVSKGINSLKRKPTIAYLIYLLCIASAGINYSLAGLFPKTVSISRVTSFDDSDFYQ